VYASFQGFDDLYGNVNRSLGMGNANVSLYREYVGMETTFFDGNASIEFRLPLNTLRVTGVPGQNGNHTAMGDLSMILRYALYRDDQADNWFTLGLAVTAPTGPSTLGGIDAPALEHGTFLQPFIGYLWNFGDLYVQGFSAVDVPTTASDATVWYNDVGIGYFVYRTAEPGRFLTAVAPAFEAHVATPLNYRGNLGVGNPFAISDEVSVGLVGNFELWGRTRLAVGAVAPVTGPQSFRVEGVIQLRCRF
jgi:hypothetical protein